MPAEFISSCIRAVRALLITDIVGLNIIPEIL